MQRKLQHPFYTSDPFFNFAGSRLRSAFQGLTSIIEEGFLKYLVRTGRKDPDMSSALDSSFGQSVTLYQGINVSSNAKEPTEETFSLLKLPPELRAMIYELLIQAGDLSILTVSKLVSKEAVHHLSKVAILRVKLGQLTSSNVIVALTAKMTLSGILTLHAPGYIQHLDLCFNIVRRPWIQLDTQLVQMFSGDQIPRRSCKIKILFGLLGATPYSMKECQTYQVIAALTGFKTLTLELAYRKDATQEASIIKRFGLLQVADDQDVARYMLLKDYRAISEFLSLTLGPAGFDDSIKGHHLKFWPRAYKLRGLP